MPDSLGSFFEGPKANIRWLLELHETNIAQFDIMLPLRCD